MEQLDPTEKEREIADLQSDLLAQVRYYWRYLIFAIHILATSSAIKSYAATFGLVEKSTKNI